MPPNPPPAQIDLPYAVSEDELRHSLGLAGYTTGKGKPALDPNIRAIEVFMCSVVRGGGARGSCAAWGWGGVGGLAGRGRGPAAAAVALQQEGARGGAAARRVEEQAAGGGLRECAEARPSHCAPRPRLQSTPQAKRMGYGEGFRWLSQVRPGAGRGRRVAARWRGLGHEAHSSSSRPHLHPTLRSPHPQQYIK
jgi:hypothetical protein